MPVPSNWTQASSDALSWLMLDAFHQAANMPSTWQRPTPADVEIEYLPNEIFPPTGRRGCWHIRVNFYGRGWQDFYRQDDVDAAKEFKTTCFELLSNYVAPHTFEEFTKLLNGLRHWPRHALLTS